jgi:hypothetical protein
VRLRGDRIGRDHLRTAAGDRLGDRAGACDRAGAFELPKHGRAGAVEEDVTARTEPGQDVDLVQQDGVLDDQRVGCQDRLAHTDRALVDAAEGTTGAPMRSEPKLGNA